MFILCVILNVLQQVRYIRCVWSGVSQCYRRQNSLVCVGELISHYIKEQCGLWRTHLNTIL